jgi:hypothetical protein
MAIGLEGHTVSLTKNGYFKLIHLIDKYPSTEILNHVGEIPLDRTQARKMLAGNSRDILPDVWDHIRSFDSEDKKALLLFSIIFSHKDLIQLFKNSSTSEMQGVIKRTDIEVKTYTNLASALNEAGLAPDLTHGGDRTKYDLSRILLKNEIGPLAKEILKGHLTNMGWSDPTATQPFQRTFEEQIKSYEFNKIFGITHEQFVDWLGGENLTKRNKIIQISAPQTFSPNFFLDAVRDANLEYYPKLIHRFLASLLTKPFVILTGLSGSGKTKLAQAFVQWICQENSQYAIIPVGADWTNREPLLGYPNALKPEEYIKPDSGALDLIIQANNNPDFPHFLILDEMNLSHVERYFADFLSVMESKSEIPLYADGLVENNVPGKLGVPSNLFIIGTVNIDETTNMFSPKVLDRSNTIEFRIADKQMGDFLSNIKDLDMSALDKKGASMAKSFLEIASNKSFPTDDVEEINKTLVNFFGELKKTGSEFGYRSATEILRLINQLTGLDSKLTTAEKVDIAIIQKLLPKLHGSRRKLCPVLDILGQFCVSGEVKVIKDVFEKDNFDFESPSVLYPLSLEKIARMYKGAIDNGFASFAEA